MEATALHLKARGDVRHLIGFVERWAEVSDPTPKARLAQAQGFVALGLLDHAWIRLKDLIEADPPVPEAAVLAGRMFVAHGWASRARPLLERARSLTVDPAVADEIRLLLERCELPPPALPEADPEEADRLVLLQLAERTIAAGAQLRAQKILERLKRQDPDDARAGDLLWGIEGDFLPGSLSISEMVDRFAPDLPTMIPDSTTSEEIEHTESFRRPGGLPDEGGASFPTLFRSLGSDKTAAEGVTEDTDATIARSVAPPLFREPEGAGSGTEEFGSGDTQIVRVIQHEKGASFAPIGGRMHEPAPAEVAFDLAAFRREMGIPPSAALPPLGDVADTEPGDLEAEDENRIVLTRRESPGTADEPTGAGLETIEPDEPTGEAPARADSSEAPTQSVPPPSVREPTTPPKPDPSTTAARKRKRRAASDATPWWLFLIGLLLLLTAATLFLVLAVRVAQLLLN